MKTLLLIGGLWIAFNAAYVALMWWKNRHKDGRTTYPEDFQ